MMLLVFQTFEKIGFWYNKNIPVIRVEMVL